MPEEASLKLVNKRVGIHIPSGEVYSGMSECEQLEEKPESYPAPFSGHFHIIKNLRDVLLHGAEPCVKPEETVACAEIIEAFYRSANLGREVFVSEL